MIKARNKGGEVHGDVPFLIRGAEWIYILKAFGRMMISVFINDGTEKKFENE